MNQVNANVEVVPTPALLFQDGDVVVVNKPAGLLVHSSAWAGPREVSLVDVVRPAFGADLNPVHRLDRQASGVLVFARGGENARLWQAALADDNVDKRYLALVRGRMAQEVEIDHAIVDEDGHARAARSSVRLVTSCSVERCSLVAVRLFTGRTHQARRHLKHISHPILGDARYGKGPLNRDYRARFGLARMALHAWRLVVVHPRTQEAVVFEAPVPDDLVPPFDALIPGWRDDLVLATKQDA